MHLLFYICFIFVFTLTSPAHSDEEFYDIGLSDTSQHSLLDLSEEERSYIADKKTIIICTDPDWMPYEKFDGDGKYIGVSADYHRIISEMTGLGYVFLYTDSWSDTIKKAKAGECDILSILNQTPDRSTFLEFTSSFIKSPSVFVTRERDKFINGIGDLRGQTLAIVQGYMVDEIIRDNHPEINRIYAKNIAEALQMVSRGKAFATVGSLLEISYNIRQIGALNLKITGDAKFGYELKIGVRKGETTLLSIMNKALGAISKEERDSILNKWISIKYQQSYDYSLIWKILFVFALLIFLIAGRVIITSKYNKKLIALNKDLREAKNELEEVNKTLEKRIAEETSRRLDNERLMMQQSKLAAMGDMIGAIAHQWRQPLSAVGLLVQDIEDAYESDSLTRQQLKETVADAMGIILQMSETINDFSNFFRPDKNKECFLLSKSVGDACTMFMPQLASHNIRLILKCLDKDLTDEISTDSSFDCCSHISVKGYPNEFRHVLINLLKNAMDAVNSENPPEKKITIRILSDGRHATVCVEDTGGGISEEVAPRVFEPYFTTKQQGKGVGIGLYMSRQIIDNMDGKMWFENTGEGTVFFIKLEMCCPQVRD